MAKKPKEQKRTPKDAPRDDDDDKAQRPVTIRPTARKVGESDDNLKRRAEWFRRRTTKRDDHG